MADGNPVIPAAVKPPLTPIAPIPHKGARAPIPQRPEQLWVNVRDLRVDHAYQRKLGARSATLIRKMVEGWDWTLVQAITVAELPGGLWEVIDGQHRAVAAATHGGIPMLPATVLQGAIDKQTAARAFVAVNSHRVAVSPSQILKSAIAAGDPEARAVFFAAQDAGAKLLFNPPSHGRFAPGSTIAAGALRKIAREHGGDRLRAILALGVAAELAPIRAEHLTALALLLTAPELADEARSEAHLIDALRDWPAIRDAADMRRLDTGQPLPRCLALELHARAS